MKLLRRKEVTERTGVNRSHLYQLMTEGRFPKPVRLGENSVAWVETEIEAWVKARISERDEGAK